MKKTLRFLFLAIFVVPALTISHSYANDGGKGGFPDMAHDQGSDINHNMPRAGSAPLDGGIILLLVAGLGLGIKIMVDKNKAQKKIGILD